MPSRFFDSQIVNQVTLLGVELWLDTILGERKEVQSILENHLFICFTVAGCNQEVKSGTCCNAISLPDGAAIQ